MSSNFCKHHICLFFLSLEHVLLGRDKGPSEGNLKAREAEVIQKHKELTTKRTHHEEHASAPRNEAASESHRASEK